MKFPHKIPEEAEIAGRSGFSLASFQDSAFILDLAFAHSLPPRISLTEATVSQSLLDKVL